MTDLAAWLLEQIAVDEDEAYWIHHADCATNSAAAIGGFPCDCPWPTRIAAECEAKRRIVEWHYATGVYSWNPRGHCGACSYQGDDEARLVDFPCPTLRLLALPYDDRPGFREEWRLAAVPS